MGEHETLEGKLWSVPFGQSETETKVREAYCELRDEYGSENVLVLSAAPTSIDTFEAYLQDLVPGASVPHVSSLIVHATDVVNTVTDQTILSDTLRRELVHRFLATTDWETNYLQQASNLESFAGDIAQLMETATWQDVEFNETPELIEVQTVLNEFHGWLADQDHIERGQLLTTALDCLSEPENRSAAIDYDAILAVEFEEFAQLERQYLATLTTSLELVCVSERDSSVRRTGIETGPLTDLVSMDIHTVEESETPDTRPEATARYLATGTVPPDPELGNVNVLHADSAAEQLDLIVDKIERLREKHDWQYSEFAVALNQGGSAVSKTIQELTQAGVPTESTTVIGFGDDPAIRELLSVARYFAVEVEGSQIPLETEEQFDSELLSNIASEEDSLADTLRYWATASGLKDRIAERASPLDARSEFGNVRRAFAMAEFIEETEFIEASWQTFVEMLERAHEHAATETQTSATDLDGGVRVDHLQALKNESWRVVFIPTVIDEEYPGQPFVTRLFSQESVLRMSDFPGITDVTASEVQDTFRTTSTASSRPIKQYHVEQSRRRLATGANVASDSLYFCLYDHTDTGLDEHVQPSRFITDAYRQLPWLGVESEDEIWSQRQAEEFVLSRIDRALADVQRTQSRDVTVSLDDLESDIGEIQRLLDDSGDRGDALREALRARIDLSSGRVSRE